MTALSVKTPTGVLHVDAGRFSPVEGARSRWLDATQLVVVPGYLDLQCNGAFGIDLTTEPERLWELAMLLPRFGVTSFLPTLISCDDDVVRRAQDALHDRPRTFRGAEPLGLHLEGPHLHPERRGAHPLDLICPPAARTSVDGIAMVTLAPELPGALELTAQLADAGVVVSLGHTNATSSESRAAFDRGATAATHLFNAMRPLHHREVGIVGACLDDTRATVGLLVDGVHVTPELVRLAWRLLGPDRFLLVSDSVAALGAGSGTLGGSSLVVDGDAVRVEDGQLAGSLLSMDRAVRNLVAYTGCEVGEALGCATRVPARLLRLEHKGSLRAGADADLVVLTPGLEILSVVACGNVVLGEELWKS